MRILAVLGGIVLLVWLLGQCGVNIPTPRLPIVAPAPQPAAGPAVQPTTASAPAAPAGAQADPAGYVGIPPQNAATGPAPANDIGLAILDGVTYQFNGGARRWFGPWQTGKPQSPQMAGVPFQAKTKASCQTAGWRLFADAVNLAMGGNSVLSSNPGIVEILCPFEETEFVVIDGQLGFVTAEWADWAWQDRVTGFQKASGHSAQGRKYQYDPGSRKLTRIG